MMETTLRSLGAKSLSPEEIKASFTPLSATTTAKPADVPSLITLLEQLDNRQSVDELRASGCARAVVAVLFATIMQRREDQGDKRHQAADGCEEGDIEDKENSRLVEGGNKGGHENMAGDATELAAKTYLKLLLSIPAVYDFMVLGVVLRRLASLCNTSRKSVNGNGNSKDLWGDLHRVLDSLPLGSMHPECITLLADIVGKGLITPEAVQRHQSRIALLALANEKLHGRSHTLASSMMKGLAKVVVYPKLSKTAQLDLLEVLRRVVEIDKRESSVNVHEVAEFSDIDDEELFGDEVLAAPKHATIRCSQGATLTLLQNCCIRCPPRAQDRISVARIILELVQSLEDRDYKLFERLLRKQSSHPRAVVRVFALELTIQLLLSNPERSTLDLLTKVIITRTRDKIPSVRLKALSSLAQALPSSDVSQQIVLEQISSGQFDLKERVNDVKSGVRKAATQLLGATLLLFVDSTTQDCSGEYNPVTIALLLNLLRSRCCDRVVGVRKAAIIALSKGCSKALALEIDKAEPYLKTWISGVLPRVRDNERSVQDACLESFSSIVFSTLEENPCLDSLTFILKTMDVGQSSSGRYASYASSVIGSHGGVGVSVVRALQNRCFGDHEDGRDSSWGLLAAIVTSSKDRKIRKAIDGVGVTDAALRGQGGASSCHIAATIANDLTPEERMELGKKTFAILSTFQIESFQSVSALVLVLSSLDPSCGEALLVSCEHVFNGVGTNTKDEGKRLIPVLATLGETVTSFTLQKPPSEALITYVKALTDPYHPTEVRATAFLALGKLCMCEVKPPGNKQETSTSNTSTASLRQGFGESLARRSISLFVSELMESDGTIATMVNSIIVLGELCKRYTSIVEAHTVQIATCLRHGNSMIRKQSFTTINNLIQQDYLKLRSGTLFFRLTLSMLDSDDEIVSLARYCFMEIHNKRNPHLFSLNFVELIYVLNDCRVHKSFNQFKKSDTEERFLKDRTCEDFESRKSLYTLFLANIPEEIRVGIPTRIRNDILSIIAEDKLELGDSGVCGILSDSLYLLTTPELRADTRFSVLDQSAVADDDQADDEVVQSQTSRAAKKTKSQILSKISESELRDGTVPVLIELRRHLEKKRSPLLSNVSQCLGSILLPYENELGSIIDDDKNLRNEIEYDIGLQKSAS